MFIHVYYFSWTVIFVEKLSLSPAGLERTREGGSPLVPALSGESQTGKVSVSGQTINSWAASWHPVGQRERAGYFMVVVLLLVVQ